MPSEQKLELFVKINSETGQLELVSKKFQEAAQSAGKADQGFLGLGKTATDLLKVVGTFASAHAIFNFMKSSVEEAEKENEALRRLSFNLQANGISWEKNSKAIQEWAASLQRATRFGDTEAFSSLERMVRVTGNLEQAQNAVKLAMDLSVASGKDLSATQDIVAQLMAGNVRQLNSLRGEYGAFIGTATTAQQALDNFARAVSGASEKESSYTKSTSQLKNEIGDLQEALGNGLIPILTDTITQITTLLNLFNRTKDATAGFAASITESLADFTKKVGTLGLSNFVDPFKPVKDSLENIIAKERELTTVVQQETEKRGQLRAAKGQQEIAAENQKNLELLKSTQQQADSHVQIWSKMMEDKKKITMNFHEAEMEADRLAVEAYKKNMEERQAQAEAVARQISSYFGNAFADMILSGKSFEDAMTDIINSILRMIINLITQMLIMKAIKGSVTGGAGFFFAPGMGAAGGVSAAPGLNPMGVKSMMQNLTEEVLSESSEGQKLARALNNLQDRNTQRAV